MIQVAARLLGRKPNGREKFPILPLSLNGTKLGVLEEFFGQEPVYISVSSAAGGIEAAMNAILVAMGKRLPADVPVAPQPKAEPAEELVLELTDLKFHEQDGVRRASADPEAAWLRPFIQALLAIVASSRDRTLADAPDLDYRMAAEILFLLETLEKAGK